MWKNVFVKEMLEMKRDKRAAYSAVLTPMILIWLFVVLFGVMERAVKEPKSTKFHIVKAVGANPVLDALKKQDTIKIVEVPSLEAGEKLIKDGEAKLVLKFDDDFQSKLGKASSANVVALYDKAEIKSGLALGIFQEIVSKINRASLEGVLVAKNLPKSAAEPIHVEEREIKIDEALGGSILLGMIPYLVVIWAFYGGMSIVGDMVAGEKEKQTLETLLISPVSRRDIALGKFSALSLLCLVSSLTTLIGIFVLGALNLPITRGLFPHGVSISPLAMVGILASLVPLVALFAASMLAVSAFARNIREAQTYLTMLSFIVLMPAIFSQFIGFTDFAHAKWIAAVPILNTSTAIREALLGKSEISFIAIAASVNLVIALVALMAAIRMFSHEKVLLRV